MTINQFIAACKTKNVNVKNIVFDKKSTVIVYNYDLPGDKLSDTYKKTYTYSFILADALSQIFANHFKQADKLVRF